MDNLGNWVWPGDLCRSLTSPLLNTEGRAAAHRKLDESVLGKTGRQVCDVS